LTLEAPEYPERLRLVELPPPLIFVRGSVEALSAANAVAVVGTRRPSDKGRLIAGWIGSAIARTGAAVISGLAVGIDGAAHAAVVAEGGTTVAVLGGGHARLFPAAHERLADAIVGSGGAVVSELAPETTPSRGTFPRRNRLVSGLSDATVVVEAGRRSGALITAGWALEQGRECFLVPGPFDAPTSAGCHAFLRSFPGQARVVSGIPELIEDLGLDGRDAPGSEAQASAGGAGAKPARPSSSVRGAGPAAVLATLAPVELAVAERLAQGPATADQLAGHTSLAAASVLSALTLLELRGLARCAYGRYFPTGALAGWHGQSPRGRGEPPGRPR
jgi:DNA processing protein